MKLTLERALDKTIKVWEKKAESGSEEHRFCYLCRYAPNECNPCPWFKYMGDCADYDSPYLKWNTAKTPRSRKFWANQCVEILYAIRELEVTCTST